MREIAKKYEVRKILVLGMGHLPEELWTGNLPEVMDGAYSTAYGVMVWVPDDPEDSSVQMVGQVPPAVLAAQKLARGLGCDWVFFDQDGERVEGLEWWEW